MHRILLVDDVPDSIMAIGRPLMGEYEVLIATCGADALQIAATQRPDLMLLDVQMPGMDGFEVLRTLRAAGSSLPVIFISADDSNTLQDSARAAGAAGVLVKPVDLAMLRRQLNGVLTDGLTGS